MKRSLISIPFELSLLLSAFLALSSAAAVRPKPTTLINANVGHILSYDHTPGDFSCAKQNVDNQDAVAPNWPYTLGEEGRTSPDASTRDPVPNAWEPILEPVPGCNGLPDGQVREFSFTAVLDQTWVDHYNKHSAQFAVHGYDTVQNSVHMLVDRADYLYRMQFGIALRLSQVFVLPDLGHDCANNDEAVDVDGSTLRALRAAGHDTLPTDTNLLRFGANNDECNSYVDGDAELGDGTGIAVMMEPPFTDDGHMRYDASQALAHELGHLFGICLQDNAHCVNSHTVDEIPDIMVWDPTKYGPQLKHGFVYKFLTTCTPVYRDILCKKAREAGGTVRAAAGGEVAPPAEVPSASTGHVNLAGEYFASAYAGRSTDWHHVTVTEKTADTTYVWTNDAGVSWELTRRTDDPDLFDVSESCPYFSRGYTVAATWKGVRNGREVVLGIYGPWDELYELVSR